MPWQGRRDVEQLPMSQLQQPKCRRHHSHCRQTLPWHSCPSCSAQQVNVSNSKQPEAGRLGMRLLRCQSPRAAFPSSVRSGYWGASDRGSTSRSIRDERGGDAAGDGTGWKWRCRPCQEYRCMWAVLLCCWLCRELAFPRGCR